MTKPSKELWHKRFKEIPEAVREAMISEESADAVAKISENAKLQEKQSRELASLTGLVMLGFLHPRDYISTISEDVGVPMMSARDMAREINERIFHPVRAELKELHGIAGNAVAPTEGSISAPVPPTQTTGAEHSAQSDIDQIDQRHVNPDLEKLEQARERKILGSDAKQFAGFNNAQSVASGSSVSAVSKRPLLAVLAKRDLSPAPAEKQAVSSEATLTSKAPAKEVAKEDVSAEASAKRDLSAEALAKEDKLTGTVSRPPEKINMGNSNDKEPSKSYGASDPYREPIE